MSDDQLVVRECNRSIKRDNLIREWAQAGLLSRLHLLAHMDECIRLVEFELKIIHNLMHRRGIVVWDESFMREGDEEEERK